MQVNLRDPDNGTPAPPPLSIDARSRVDGRYVIKRLLADGLVAESTTRAAPELGEERRRYYRITPLGGRVAGQEVRRLQALVNLPSVRALAARYAP